jgi:hypothetical protein
MDHVITVGDVVTVWGWTCAAVVVFVICLAILARVNGWWH